MRLFGGVLGLSFVATGLILLSSLVGAAPAGGGTAASSVHGPFYNATFNETGLPPGTVWGVHVAYVGCSCDGVRKTVTSNLSTVAIPVTNGTYNYNLVKVPGYYVNVSAHGSFNVSGAPPPTITVAFHPLIPFSVEFTETGLPNGTLWTVHVTGNGQGQEHALEDQTASSYGTSLNFSLPNGTYHYTVAPVNGSFFVGRSSHGKFVVAGGSPPSIAVAFVTPPTTVVRFSESALPLGTNWSVRVNGIGAGGHVVEQLSSTTGNVTFALPNGTYRYLVGGVLGFVNSPVTGSVNVTGTPVAINVSYTLVAQGAFYPVAFEENGLPNGTSWAVTVTITHTIGHSRTETQTSSGTTIYFLLQNASYKFRVHEARGYAVTLNPLGTFLIAGASPAVVIVNFTAIPTYAVTINVTGLPSDLNWSSLVRTQSAGASLWNVHVTQTTNGTSVTFYVPNGTYCYRVTAVPGFRVSSGVAAGSVTVAGSSPAVISVGFTARA